MNVKQASAAAILLLLPVNATAQVQTVPSDTVPAFDTNCPDKNKNENLAKLTKDDIFERIKKSSSFEQISVNLSTEKLSNGKSFLANIPSAYSYHLEMHEVYGSPPIYRIILSHQKGIINSKSISFTINKEIIEINFSRTYNITAIQNGIISYPLASPIYRQEYIIKESDFNMIMNSVDKNTISSNETILGIMQNVTLLPVCKLTIFPSEFTYFRQYIQEMRNTDGRFQKKKLRKKS